MRQEVYHDLDARAKTYSNRIRSFYNVISGIAPRMCPGFGRVLTVSTISELTSSPVSRCPMHVGCRVTSCEAVKPCSCGMLPRLSDAVSELPYVR